MDLLAALSPGTIIGIVSTAVVAFLAIGTAPGRHLIGNMFKGQSAQQIAAQAADDVARVRDLYELTEKDCKERIDRLEGENFDLRNRMKVLEDIVTARSEIIALATAIQNNRTHFDSRFQEVLTEMRTGKPNDGRT